MKVLRRMLVSTPSEQASSDHRKPCLLWALQRAFMCIDPRTYLREWTMKVRHHTISSQLSDEIPSLVFPHVWSASHIRDNTNKKTIARHGTKVIYLTLQNYFICFSSFRTLCSV